MTQSFFLTGHDVSFLTHFSSFSYSMDLFVSLCICVYFRMFKIQRRVRKREGKNDDNLVLLCVFCCLCLFSPHSLHLSFSLVECWGKWSNWLDSCPGLFLRYLHSGLMTNGFKFKKDSLQLSGCQYPITHSFSIYLSTFYIHLCTNKITSIQCRFRHLYYAKVLSQPSFLYILFLRN